MIDPTTALSLMKTRLNRLSGDTSLDGLFGTMLEAAEQELEKTGIVLNDTAQDMMLVVNTAVWHYQSRDSQAGMPDWLRLQRRERWLNQRKEENNDP